MNIYLAKRVHVGLTDIVSDQVCTEHGQPLINIYTRTSYSIPVTITLMNVNQVEKVTKLQERLVANSYSDSDGSRVVQEHTLGLWEMAVDIGIYNPLPSRNLVNDKSHNSSSVAGFIRVRDYGNLSKVLEGLSKIYGKGLKLTVKVENIKCTIHGNTVLWQEWINITEADVIFLSRFKKYGVEKSGLEMRSNITANEWKSYNAYNDGNNGSWEACISIIAVVPDENTAVDTVTDKFCINKKIMLEEVSCDAVIIAENGVKIKCHKAFLTVHSSVFATMFKTDMLESQTSTIEMPDMSEASVRAFLAYLYCWETNKAESDSFVCFELFAAGHKYDICRLEKDMEKIMLRKKSDWYDLGVAIKLFSFSRNLLDGANLKTKAVIVLKSRCAELKESFDFKMLFKDEPEAAMELFIHAFSA